MYDVHYRKKNIDEIKEKTNIVDIINEDINLIGDGKNFHGHCPFCKSNDVSLAVSGQKQIFECIDCGENGDVFSYVMKSKNMSFNQSIKYLAEKANIALPEPAPYIKREQEINTILEINKEAALFYYKNLMSKNGNDGLDYLIDKRGMDKKIITEFGIGFAGNSYNELKDYLSEKGFTVDQMLSAGVLATNENKTYDKFRNRIMCPIIDENKNVIAFSGRLITEQKEKGKSPKYLNSPETLVFDKKRTLYGIFASKDNFNKGAVVCEGNLDVVSMHQAGINNAVAPLGTAFSQLHALVLGQYTDTIHLAFDNDQAGIKATMASIPILQKMEMNTDVIDLSPYNDPDEFIKSGEIEKLKERINNPINPIIFQVKNWIGNANTNTEKDQKEVFETFAKHMEEIPKKLEKEYVHTFNKVLRAGRERTGPVAGAITGTKKDSNGNQTIGNLWKEDFNFDIEH